MMISIMPDQEETLPAAQQWQDNTTANHSFELKETPTPEQNIIPKRRPSPPYYLVNRHIEEIGDLTEDLPANIAAAMNCLYRAGRKPGNDVCDDLLKAVDHLLKEYDRQKRLLELWRRMQDKV